jgi:predicted lipid carrier protein YhbT
MSNGRGGQWADSVGEAKAILDNVLVGWERDLPRDVLAALARAAELLEGTGQEIRPTEG